MFEEKASTSRVKRSSGSYTFRIEGYSGLSTRVGDSTESPEFELCGHMWQLRIFPGLIHYLHCTYLYRMITNFVDTVGGSLEAHKGFISYYLASKVS